jgi:ribose 5-phosphate isomerase B
MTVYFAADHAGFELKQALLEYVRAQGHDPIDLSPPAPAPDDDYPDVVTPLAERIAGESRSVAPGGFLTVAGVVVGGSGQGEAMAANRILSCRAAVFYGLTRARAPLDAEGDEGRDGYDIVRLARAHNNANILSLGARFVGEEEAKEALRLFLTTPFSLHARHVRRLAKF